MVGKTALLFSAVFSSSPNGAVNTIPKFLQVENFITAKIIMNVMSRQIGEKIDQHPGVGRQSVQIVASVQVSNSLERRPWRLNMSPHRITE
jgi:hypothetical protein